MSTVTQDIIAVYEALKGVSGSPDINLEATGYITSDRSLLYETLPPFTIRHEWNSIAKISQILPHSWIIFNTQYSTLLRHLWSDLGVAPSLHMQWRVLPSAIQTLYAGGTTVVTPISYGPQLLPYASVSRT